MNKNILTIFCFFCIAANVCCKSKHEVFASLSDTLIYNDSIRSSLLITRDDNDDFFKNLQALDVAIQMKDNQLLENPNYVAIYKKHLKSQVSNFNQDDKVFLNAVYKKVLSHLKNIQPSLNIKLSVSKIKPQHYGNDVFYTRGEVIFLPENIFIEKNEKKLVSIFLHELWHIISEQQPDLKEKMYKLIGFHKHGRKVVLPAKLEKLMLSNPDGGDRSYGMKLNNGKWLLPLISSNQNGFNNAKPVFYDYLQFDVFYINAQGMVEVNDDLSSTVSNEDNMEFFQKIKDNTQYIIHPDEIVADNFMLAVLAENTNDYKNFSDDGQKLLKEVINLIKVRNNN